MFTLAFEKTRFFFDLGRVWEAKFIPKSFLYGIFEDVFFVPSFMIDISLLLMLVSMLKPLRFFFFVKENAIIKVLHVWHFVEFCMQNGSQNKWILRAKFEKSQ